MEITVNTGVSNASGHSVTLFQQVSNCVFHENVNTFVNASFLQCPNQFKTGCVTNVGQSWESVSSEVPLVNCVLRCSVKHSAPLFQFSYTVGCFFGMEFCHSPISKPFASLHGVMKVNFPAISGVRILQGSSTATFSHNGMRFAEQRFGNDGGFSPSSCRFNCSPETCSSSTNDDDIVFIFLVFFSQFPTSNYKQRHIRQMPFTYG